jgi:hypothetical protein
LVVFAGGALALIAVGVLVLLLSGGGGSGSDPSAGGTTASVAKEGSKPKPEPSPKPLSRRELIARADAICADSQSTYKSVRSPASEESPDVAYAATLAGISQRGVNRFRRLVPPPTLKASFDSYVEAQERVMRYDRQALKAAEAGDTSAYLAARERRDAETRERYELARAVGLERCSPKPTA